jgi:hypothetical protein
MLIIVAIVVVKFWRDQYRGQANTFELAAPFIILLALGALQRLQIKTKITYNLVVLFFMNLMFFVPCLGALSR